MDSCNRIWIDLHIFPENRSKILEYLSGMGRIAANGIAGVPQNAKGGAIILCRCLALPQKLLQAYILYCLCHLHIQ